VIGYSDEIKSKMRRYYNSLSEKDKRRYAAIEALKLGYGGIKYISVLLDCNYRTIIAGMKDLDSEDAMSLKPVRVQGGGRKKYAENFPEIDKIFLMVIRFHQTRRTSKFRLIDLSKQEVKTKMEEQGINVSVRVIDQLFNKHKIRYGKNSSKQPKEP
jgi:hypothetical protein